MSKVVVKPYNSDKSKKEEVAEMFNNISKKYFVDIPEKKFFDMVRAGFKSKRKKLSSNLSTIFPKDRVWETFQKLKLGENLRAEDVDIATWKQLVVSLKN